MVILKFETRKKKAYFCVRDFGINSLFYAREKKFRFFSAERLSRIFFKIDQKWTVNIFKTSREFPSDFFLFQILPFF